MDRGSSAVGKLSSAPVRRARGSVRESPGAHLQAVSADASRVRPGLHLAERGLALLLLILTAPLFGLVALIVWRSDRGEILYRGLRLGLGKRPFTMYKFRTLRRNAQLITGAELLDQRLEQHVQLTIPRGKFLRETRLDELPQLWNVLRGEMSFVGPRPERPEVYAAHRGIDGYEQRFSVRPGMIGFSQLFTPHGTHKRYRTLIDNARIRHGQRGLSTVRIVTYAGLVVLAKALRRTLHHLRNDFLQSRVLGRYREKRRLRRVRPEGARISLELPGESTPRHGRVIDMNEQAMLVVCPGLSGALRADARLEVSLGAGMLRSARCETMLSHTREHAGGQAFVLQYRPETARCDYIIHQYFLRSSLATPPSSRRFRRWHSPQFTLSRS